MNKVHFRILLVFSFLMLMGCQLGPRYSPLPVDTPESWKNPTKALAAPAVDFWWEIFDDPQLNALETLAVKNNPVIFTALQRVIEARSMAGVSRANLFPQLTLAPSYDNAKYLAQFQTPAQEAVESNQSFFRLHQINYVLPLDLSYQVDLWGAYRGQWKSAVYNAEAEAEAYLAALLTLTTDLAGAYFELRMLDAQIDLLNQTSLFRKDEFEINQSRWDAGLINFTDVSRAELEFTNAQADLYDAMRLRNNAENRIAVLIGSNASTFKLPHSALSELPPSIPANLPSEVLLRRPDVAQAERQMASQHALIGVAYAAFLPQFSLTGAVGYESPDLKRFLKWDSRLWAMGAEAIQSIFDGGRNISNLDAAWASYRQTLGNYRNLVLVAFQEVEDALADIEFQEKEYRFVVRSQEAAQITTTLSLDRYNKGLVNYLEVVDSERAQLQVNVRSIKLLGDLYLSTIQLVKAIGGGWDATCIPPDSNGE